MRLAIWFYAFVFLSTVYHAKCSLIESNYEPEEDNNHRYLKSTKDLNAVTDYFIPIDFGLYLLNDSRSQKNDVITIESLASTSDIKAKYSDKHEFISNVIKIMTIVVVGLILILIILVIVYFILKRMKRLEDIEEMNIRHREYLSNFNEEIKKDDINPQTLNNILFNLISNNEDNYDLFQKISEEERSKYINQASEMFVTSIMCSSKESNKTDLDSLQSNIKLPYLPSENIELPDFPLPTFILNL